MAGKKTAKKGSRSAADKAASGTSSRAAGNTLNGSVFHGGRMYSSKRKGDADALQKALENEKDPAKQKANSLAMQRLAEKGRVRGFGTKAGTKAADNKPGKPGRVRAELEAEGEGEEGLSPDEQAGGGVDTLTGGEVDEQEEE